MSSEVALLSNKAAIALQTVMRDNPWPFDFSKCVFRPAKKQFLAPIDLNKLQYIWKEKKKKQNNSCSEDLTENPSVTSPFIGSMQYSYSNKNVKMI